jgi:poly-gamma-glutamate synthesis protein (capsule biosynthesis protein)
MITFALSGGCIINRRFSVCDDGRFLRLVDVIRDADVSFSHLEGTIADADGPEVYPAAEAGWTWIRTPSYFGDELKWAGFNLVSHASNHSLDYMYGGLYSTWSNLKRVGLPFAGTGMTLKDARRPAYLETAKGRVALISSSSSTPDWARAADPIRDDRGRPGVNQVRQIHLLDAEGAEALRATTRRAGWWMSETGDDIMVSPPGLHNTVTRYRIVADATAAVIADPDDVRANVEAIRVAKEQADFVMFHIHNHEWDPQGGLAVPPAFVRSLAHDCIDAGADIFMAEGSHALLRGIEIYKGKPIFYDPGDLFKDGNAKTRPLSEYYWVQGKAEASGRPEFTTAASRSHDGFGKLPVPTNPVGGYNTGKVLAVIVPVCRFDDAGRLVELRIHPAVHLNDSHLVRGLPGLQTGEDARRIIDYLAELSAPFGTHIDFDDGVGVVRL